MRKRTASPLLDIDLSDLVPMAAVAMIDQALAELSRSQQVVSKQRVADWLLDVRLMLEPAPSAAVGH